MCASIRHTNQTVALHSLSLSLSLSTCITWNVLTTTHGTGALHCKQPDQLYFQVKALSWWSSSVVFSLETQRNEWMTIVNASFFITSSLFFCLPLLLFWLVVYLSCELISASTSTYHQQSRSSAQRRSVYEELYLCGIINVKVVLGFYSITRFVPEIQYLLISPTDLWIEQPSG